MLPLALGSVLLLVSTIPCLALSPRTGDLAVTAAVGLDGSLGDRDVFDPDVVWSMSFDFHWSSRNSLRGTLGTLDLASDVDGFSSAYLTANVAHNWFGRAVFPYVSGGIGLYAASHGNDDSVEVGLNGGGGFEIRLSDTWTVRMDLLLHALTGGAPSTIAVGSTGIKVYF